MQESISSKELMLKKIRKALLEKRDNPYLNHEDTPLYKEAAEIPEILFAEELTAIAGNFIFCENGIDFIENMLDLAARFKWRKIYCWEPELQELLKHYEFPFYETDKDFEMAEVGITLCEALIARNGSVLVSNKGAAGRRLSIYPHHHIVIARTGQLVMDLGSERRFPVAEVQIWPADPVADQYHYRSQPYGRHRKDLSSWCPRA